MDNVFPYTTVGNQRFRRNNILDDMRKTAETSYTQPIRYYRENHGVIPPWILLKGVYFATLVNFVRSFKAPQREKLVNALYGKKIEPKQLDEYKDIMSDTLFLCLEYRNLAAHGGRTYNYIPKSSIRCLENSEIASGLPQLVQVLNMLDYNMPYEKLTRSIKQTLDKYAPKFPDDIGRLEQATGVHIEKSV